MDAQGWMLMDAVFHCQRDRLTFRPFALGEELTNWKKTEILFYLSRKSIWSGQQAEGGLGWLCWKWHLSPPWCPPEGHWWGQAKCRAWQRLSSWLLKLLRFLESLFYLCSLFSPGVLVFYAIFWNETWGHFSPIHEPDRCKPRLDQKAKSQDSHWFWPNIP